jgi:hypothetical protein
VVASWLKSIDIEPYDTADLSILLKPHAEHSKFIPSAQLDAFTKELFKLRKGTSKFVIEYAKTSKNRLPSIVDDTFGTDTQNACYCERNLLST